MRSLLFALLLLAAVPAAARDVLVPRDMRPEALPARERMLVFKLAWTPTITLAEHLLPGDCVDVPLVAAATRLCWQDDPSVCSPRAVVAPAGAYCLHRVEP